MYVYRIIAPPPPPSIVYTQTTPPLRASLHIKDYHFRYSGQQNNLATSSIPTKNFNRSCKPTNTTTRTFNTFLGPPIRHIELQYVPSTTYTVNQLTNTPTTANIATHTFSTSIGPPTPPLRPSARSWYHQHRHSDHQCIRLRRPPRPLRHIVHAYVYQRYHSCLERSYTIAQALRPPGRLWDKHTPSSINKRHHSDLYCAYRTKKTPYVVDDFRA